MQAVLIGARKKSHLVVLDTPDKEVGVPTYDFVTPTLRCLAVVQCSRRLPNDGDFISRPIPTQPPAVKNDTRLMQL